MSLDNPELRVLRDRIASPTNVSISPWVNEPFPAWNEILTSHDLARLTRRHCWILGALSFIGRFPKKRNFRGQPIGWLRAEVDDWLRGHQRVRTPCSKRRVARGSTEGGHQDFRQGFSR